ncbi:MAG: DUF4373 domain-containing protein [Clostridiales bacterium]|nr:DUF4373 domain-containing protein [Clostridiales bacterium]
MAKVRLDWFKLECQLDDKFRLIESEFGLIGFGVVIKIFMKIYGSEGYFCKWNKDSLFLFSKDNNLNIEIIKEIVSCAIERGIFDNNKYKEFGILTSKGIQSRYFDCCGRRKTVEVNPDYLLIPYNTKNSQQNDILIKNDSISIENADIPITEENRERIEKKRLDESRKEIFRLLSPQQYNDLSSKYGEELVKGYCKRVISYCNDKRGGKLYSDCNSIIEKWISEDKPKTKSSSSSYDIDEINEFQANFLQNHMAKNKNQEELL